MHQYSLLKFDPGYLQHKCSQPRSFLCILYTLQRSSSLLTPKLLENRNRGKDYRMFYLQRCNPRAKVKEKESETREDGKQGATSITTMASTEQWARKISASHLAGHLLSYPGCLQTSCLEKPCLRWVSERRKEKEYLSAQILSSSTFLWPKWTLPHF